MKSRNKRKRGKCQGILRISSQWYNWDMKKKRRVRKKKKMKKEEKREKGVEIQEKEEQLMMDLKEAKLINEEN